MADQALFATGTVKAINLTDLDTVVPVLIGIVIYTISALRKSLKHHPAIDLY
jgi:hypothetical protein